MEAKLRQTNPMKNMMFGTLGGPHDATDEGLRSLYPPLYPHPATWSRQERPRILKRTLSPDLLTEISTAYSLFGEDQYHSPGAEHQKALVAGSFSA